MTDRDKLEAVAASYRKLMLLRDERKATAALMIRTCVRAIVRHPTPFEDGATRRRISMERREAIEGLTKLADMLDPPAPLTQA